MKQLFFTFLLIFLGCPGQSQVEFSFVKHDFGYLEPYSARYVDLKLTNKGEKQEWLLSVKKPYEVSYITSKSMIEKDSSILVRLHVNPPQKGKFAYTIDLYTSDRNEAVRVKLTGNLSELPEDGSSMFTGCPNFSDRPGGKNPSNFDLTVVTIDKETRAPLGKSKVTMIQDGQAIWTNLTNKKGAIKEESALGLSYFYARHEGYSPAELGAYINFKRNYIVVELERSKEVVEPPVPIVPEDTITITVTTPGPPETPEEEIIVEIEETLEEDLSEAITEIIPEEAPPALAELDPDDFSEDHFKPINVVFVLDVSSSMKQADKMELMKYSLFQLAEMLRPQDKMGIVTYASDARVLLHPTSGGNKDEIREEVGALNAFGYTSGGSGIKLGFKQAKKAYLSGATNHVIIITDGAFNRNSGDYKNYVEHYKRKGIYMSVVGIKNKSVDEQEMREAAHLGGGRYVPIFKLSDAQHNLKQEVRLLTFKH